jgi:SPP1 gp7 family putative phage head morphogenesis protein
MYWQDRIAQSQSAISDKNIKQVERQLRKYYRSAAKKIIEDFEAVYEKLIAQGEEITPALLYRLDSYWELQAQLRHELQRLGDREVVALTKAFERNFFEVYYSLNIEGATTFSTIDKQAAQQMINSIWCADGKTWSSRVWTNTDKLQATLNEELIHCVVSGKKPSELKNILQDRFNVSYSQADSLVRTEIAHIQTEAAHQRYKDYGIKEVEILADEDERRCEICGDLHGRRYPIGGALPVPAHPRCRCCVVPVID